MPKHTSEHEHVSDNSELAPTGKGKPTPKRREAEAAKSRSIAGNQSKEAKKVQKLRMNEARERARVGMMAGDERYLPARDKGPQRRYVRDYVDSRISIGEFLIPAMVLVLLMTFLPAEWQVFSLLAIWGYLLLSVLDAVILGFILKKKLEEKFGAAQVQPGFRWYAGMRAMQFRMLRMPKPQVRRFQRP